MPANAANANAKLPLKFTDNERVLCYHGPLLYEAKCTQTGYRDDGTPKYMIHYNGWNKSWDEWVDETRVMKFNEENVQRQRELADNLNPKKSRKREPVKRSKSTDNDDDGKKKTRKKAKVDDNNLETEEEFKGTMEVHIPIPESLRRQLVDDWDAVTTQKKLVSLPRETTVTKILEDYRKAKSKNTSFTDGVVSEVLDGLKVYFEQALGVLLLYRFERPQYLETLEKNKNVPMCDIYGPEHLVRLFVKLPSLLAHTNMDEESLHILVCHLRDFLKYVEKNSSTIFHKSYESASPEYCRLAQT